MARRTAAKAAPAVQTEPKLVYVEPADLVLGPNVRLDQPPDKTLVASMKERGVLQPIVAYRDADNFLVVEHGSRRTRAAVEAGLPVVPVFVVPAPAAQDRLVDQLSENEHRAALTPAEKVSAVQQLAAFGVTPAQISKRLAAPRADVDAALLVAKSKQAAKVLESRPAMTVQQAAAIAEFEGDKDATNRLVAAAERGSGFDHSVQYERDQRREADQARQAGTELSERLGLPVVSRPHAAGSKTVPLSWLNLTEAKHTSCAGHSFYVDKRWSGSKKDLDDRSVQVGKDVYEAVLACRDPLQHGHRQDTAKGPTKAQKAAADAETRKQRELQEAWEAADKVRDDWLKDLLGRKTPPKGWAAFAAQVMLGSDYPVGAAENVERAWAWLGWPVDEDHTIPEWKDAAEKLVAASDQRAQVIVLAVVLEGCESTLANDRTWRPGNECAFYLRYLETLGYDLADVERDLCTAVESKG